MRNAAVRAFAGGVLAFGASGLLGGCDVLGFDNSPEVCGDVEKAYNQYTAQVKSVAANDPAQWRRTTEQLAGRLDGLAGRAEDADLKKTLKEEAGRLRDAAASLGKGDAAKLTAVLNAAPKRLGLACM